MVLAAAHGLTGPGVIPTKEESRIRAVMFLGKRDSSLALGMTPLRHATLNFAWPQMTQDRVIASSAPRPLPRGNPDAFITDRAAANVAFTFDKKLR
jgi:hypothetical protein